MTEFVLDAAKEYHTCYQRIDDTKSYRTIEKKQGQIKGVSMNDNVVSPSKIANDVEFTLTLKGQNLMTCVIDVGGLIG